VTELTSCHRRDLLHRLPQISDEWGTLVAHDGYFGGPEALAAYLGYIRFVVDETPVHSASLERLQEMTFPALR